MASLRDLDPEAKDRVLDWIETLPNHPEVGGDIKRALQKANPAMRFPDLDLEDRANAKAKAIEDKFEAFKAEQADKENKKYWADKRDKAVGDGLVKAEEVQDFHKWMMDEHLGNYERAAKMWHDEKHASAEPTNYQDITGISLPNQEGLFANPTKFARDEGLKAINEIRRGKQANY